jgi:hypothetical protein
MPARSGLKAKSRRPKPRLKKNGSPIPACNRMNLPLDLVNVLNWGATVPAGMNAAAADAGAEASADRFMYATHPVLDHMVRFALDYHKFMDSGDPAGLLDFIEKYKGDSHWRLARFANGLQMDFDAVKNALLHPDISNGPVEGKNNSIKCDKRICGGRAKTDLLTAKALLRQRYTTARAAV